MSAIEGMKELEEAMKQAHREMKDRITVVEQKITSAPIAPVAAMGEGSSRAALEKHADRIQAMARGESKECRFKLDASALNIKTTILGPVASGASALQAPDRADQIVGPAMQRLTVLALLPSLSTDAGATQFTR